MSLLHGSSQCSAIEICSILVIDGSSEDNLLSTHKVHSGIINGNMIATVSSQVYYSQQITPKFRDMQNICEFNNFGFSPTNLWLESNRTNTSRINNSIICQSDRNALWGIIVHIMTVRSHQRGCTCICIPVVRFGLGLSTS